MGGSTVHSGADAAWSEERFARAVDEKAAAADAAGVLELLCERHPCYAERGTATVTRMRGWALLALGRAGLSPSALGVVLEELESGVDPYLVAAAARALRAFGGARGPLVPYLLRGLTNIRYRDEPVSFEGYGALSRSATDPSPVSELLQTLAWTGAEAAPYRARIAALIDPVTGLSRSWHLEVHGILQSLPDTPGVVTDDCCGMSALSSRLAAWTSLAAARDVRDLRFEDHTGAVSGFDDVFVGKPSLVVFFYTRCDNPHKCSLTVTKLARVQRLLADRGVLDGVRTTAITYDPAFDTPERLRGYAIHRGAIIGPEHRLLRAVDGMPALCNHFGLGVNFIGSLVSRHRIEAHVLDAAGRPVRSFARLQWDEREVAAALEALVNPSRSAAAAAALQTAGRLAVAPGTHATGRPRRMAWLATAGTLALAVLPKCPICWAGYASALGVAGLALPLTAVRGGLIALLAVNVACLVWRGRATGRMWAIASGLAGAVFVLLSQLGTGLEAAGAPGAALVAVGAIGNALPAAVRRRLMLKPA